jgi:hypothetical protein
MRCEHCLHDLPQGARFCPGCGQAVPGAPAAPEVEPVDTSITAPGVRPGVWRWALLVLLLLERLTAIKAFPLEGAAAWERVFLYAWGWGLLAAAAPLLALRWRAGGWLAFLSGFTLILRSCVPLLSEEPVPWAVITLMAASATLTFAFLYEQSFWPHFASPMGGNAVGGNSDGTGTGGDQ